jgi:hypothetical protein
VIKDRIGTIIPMQCAGKKGNIKQPTPWISIERAPVCPALFLSQWLFVFIHAALR